eukprot:403978_1
MSHAIPDPYVWDDSFDVKYGIFNDQHKKLFALIVALDADRGNAAKLTELIDMAVLHFKTEEDVFAKHAGYTEADSHKQKHDKFVADCKAATVVDDATMKFIKNRLVHHIKGTDMAYVGKLE